MALCAISSVSNGVLVDEVQTGDSEAIVCEMSSGSPKAVKIAKTHKPADASEADRIRKLGGTVEKVGGVVRVNKDLSVSRAIGDAGLKQFVIPDPSVTYRKLTQSDEWLVIASDGLWDYMGPNTAAIVVSLVLFFLLQLT